MRTKPYVFLKDLGTLRRNRIRRQRAREYGVSFVRGPWFEMPREIQWSDGRTSLAFPREKSIKYSFMDILLDDVYGLRDVTQPFASILDIGANVGFFSLYARTRFPGAVIHAYEPNTSLAPFLDHQAKAARAERFYEAVGRESGQVRLDAGGESVLARTSADDVGEISQIPFSQALERMGGRVDCVKLDCEGAEWQILEDRESWRNVRYLAMEYHLFHPGTSHRGIARLVEAAGFVTVLQKSDATGGILHAWARAFLSESGVPS